MRSAARHPLVGAYEIVIAWHCEDGDRRHHRPGRSISRITGGFGARARQKRGVVNERNRTSRASGRAGFWPSALRPFAVRRSIARGSAFSGLRA